MPITIDGTGSISGLSAGGLPDLSVTTADIAAAAVTAPKLSGAQSGSAPIYAARAWVNFNGTGTVAIRASANVSSVTDGGTGNYTVNFTTAMQDADYAVMATSGDGSTNYRMVHVSDATAPTTSAVALRTLTQNSGNPTATDHSRVSVAIFR
jgi:hypothetical protein